MTETLTIAGVAAGAAVSGWMIARKFRAPALLLFSTAVAVGAFAFTRSQDWPVMSAAGMAIGLVAMLQSGYLAGLVLARK